MKNFTNLKERLIRLPRGTQGILLLQRGFFTTKDVEDLLNLSLNDVRVGVILCENIDAARYISINDKPAIDTGTES